MALIKCGECGKEVSTSAVACPHCGAKKPKTSIWPRLLLGILVAFGLIFLSGIYAGHLQGGEAAEAVSARLIDKKEVTVSIEKYVNSTDRKYLYVCGIAHFKTAKGSDEESWFMVTETGVFPSVVMVQIDGDMNFWDAYRNTCL